MAWVARETRVLPSLGLPRGGCRKPVTRQGEAFERTDTTFVFRPRGPLVRIRGFLLPQSAARPLKTQQRETARLRVGASLRGDMNRSSFPLEDDRIRLASAFGQRLKVSSRRV